MTRRIAVPLVLAAVVLTVGCAEQQSFQARIQETKKPMIRSDDYSLGATDAIQIEVRGQPDLSHTVLIRSDGMITLRLLGDVYVMGMTTADVDAKLTRMYKEYIVGADVTVSLVGFNSKNIYVWGQVPREGPQPYVGELTVMKAISRAGGTLPRAEPKAIQVVRNNKVWKVNLNDIVIHGKTDQNIYLQPEDIVFVPLNGFARVGFALDNVFFPLRSFMSFIFLGDAVSDLKDEHNW